MARTQVTGFEIRDDSIKGDDVDESTLVLEKIPFSNSEFTAINAKTAIIEAKKNPWYILIDESYIIGEYDQLINYNGLMVRGCLKLNGNLVLR